MGIQTLSVLTAGTGDVLEYHKFEGVDPKMLPLNLTSEAAGSRLISSLAPHESKLLSTEAVTTNLHHGQCPCFICLECSMLTRWVQTVLLLQPL